METRLPVPGKGLCQGKEEGGETHGEETEMVLGWGQ